MISPHGNRIEEVGGAIAGVVTAVPRTRLTNAAWPHAEEAAKMTGVLERRHAGAAHTTESLCFAAARKLLDDLGWAPDSIDTLVYVTQTPKSAVPAAAFDLHRELGLAQHCPAIEVNWSCSGYVYGLWLAHRLAQVSIKESRVLLLVGDTSSKIIDPSDRATAPLFGDAGSATAVLGGDAIGGTSRFVYGTDGRGADQLHQVPGEYLKMDGPAVFSFTLKQVPGLVADVLGDDEPDFLLFHQANRFMLRHLVKKCGLLERFGAMRIPSNIEEFGNCSCASIPLLMATDIAVEPHNWRRKLAMFWYGAGWAWAGAFVDTKHLLVSELIEV